MELNDELRQAIEMATLKKQGTWLFHAEGMCTTALVESGEGELIVPEPMFVLELVTVTSTEDGIEEPKRQRVMLRQTDLLMLAKLVGQLMLTDMLPQLAEINETWTVGEPGGL